MAENGAGEKPKKKRGRPKGSKSKSKVTAPKVKKPEKGPATISEAIASSEASWTAEEAAALAEDQAKVASAKAAAAKEAAEALAEKEYQAAAAEAVSVEEGQSFTNKRGQDRIFRREMGEPEFWLEKNERVPPRPILSQAEEEAISRKVQIPADQTPPYNPENVLSPEYEGISNYEIGIRTQKDETEQRLARLKGDPNSSPEEIKMVEEDLKTLDYLFENFNQGMNVFRTAKGGREKLRD